MQNALDLAIKKKELGTLDGAYKGVYRAYMDEQLWQIFYGDMRDNHPRAFLQYGAGSGGELNPKGKLPPKMASYGSSSRMIYSLSKDIGGFFFEYKLPTTVGGVANMDGYLECPDRHIFIEAKCREPYGSHANSVSDKYRDLYNYLNEANNSLGIIYSVDDKKLSCTFTVGGTVVEHLDVKQIICHLLGMATRFLTYPSDKGVTFVYLCYCPQYLAFDNATMEAKIFKVYDRMCEEFRLLDVKALFADVVRYLMDSKKKICNATALDAELLVSGFNTVLVDQMDYVDMMRGK